MWAKDFSSAELVFADDHPLHVFAEKHLSTLPASDWVALADWDLPDVSRKELQALWWDHAADEYRALSQFSHLMADMVQIGAPMPWIGCVSRLIRDETRHVLLCVKAAAALGMDVSSQHLQAARPDTDVGPVARIARHLLTTVYAAETVALDLIGWARDRETIPPLKAVMTAILADESFHSRFGFLWLRDNWNHLDSAAQAAALESLPIALQRLSTGVGPVLQPIACSTIEKTIVPALETLGISALAAWEQGKKTG